MAPPILLLLGQPKKIIVSCFDEGRNFGFSFLFELVV